MPSYPTYTVAGVQCDDPSGRWELMPGTSVLSTFPGRRVSNYTVPGQVGNRSAVYAPGEAATVRLAMRFNAVGAMANKIVSGTAAKAAALSANLDLFFQSTGLARQGYIGLVELRRYFSAGDYRTANGRVVSASEPQWSAHSDHALVEFIFEVPAGAWGSPTADVTRAVIPGNLFSQRVKVPAGTAPSISNIISFKGPYDSAAVAGGRRISVTNGSGTGFRVGQRDGRQILLTSAQRLVINTETWACGITPTSTPIDDHWGVNKPYLGWLDPVARPMGSALTILPQAGDDSDKGYLHFWLPAQMEVHVRSRRMWY